MELMPELVAGVPFVLAVTQQVKTTLDLDGRYVWLASMLIGVAGQAGYGWVAGSFDLATVVVVGVLNGLSASGVYAGVKTGPGSVGRPSAPAVVDFND